MAGQPQFQIEAVSQLLRLSGLDTAAVKVVDKFGSVAALLPIAPSLVEERWRESRCGGLLRHGCLGRLHPLGTEQLYPQLGASIQAG